MLAKNLALYRIGNGPTREIGQKYTKNTENPIVLVFLAYFCPILRVAVFPCPVGGQVFPYAMPFSASDVVAGTLWRVGATHSEHCLAEPR